MAMPALTRVSAVASSASTPSRDMRRREGWRAAKLDGGESTPKGTTESDMRIIIVDDHELFARGLEVLFRASPEHDVSVVGFSAHAADAAGLVHDLEPDMALIDLQMPPPGGLYAIEACKKASPATKVIVLTGVEDVDAARAALRIGADGYVLKVSSPSQLVPLLHAVANGYVVMPTWLATELARTPASQSPHSDLSDEELRLLTRVAKGLGSVEIANELYVSERTVKRLLSNLYRRIGVDGRIEAVIWAAKAGVV
jgi:two-component system, NarL family, nitrate/nitrite response regulator NarL